MSMTKTTSQRWLSEFDFQMKSSVVLCVVVLVGATKVGRLTDRSADFPNRKASLAFPSNLIEKMREIFVVTGLNSLVCLVELGQFLPDKSGLSLLRLKPNRRVELSVNNGSIHMVYTWFFSLFCLPGV